MTVIANNLETEQDIKNYEDWLSGKKLHSIKSIKRMLEVDKKHRPNKWKNLDLRIKLMEIEIEKRKLWRGQSI